MTTTQHFDLQAAGIPAHLQEFPPTHEAALQRIAALSPSQYARSRNALDGAVSGLSPYLTHGIISLPEAAGHIAQKYKLSYDDKLIFEFGWREFFHHVWEHAKSPEDVLRDMRPANLWRGAYAQRLPADIREGRTGVPCIDTAVRQLYATGYLHNHARMWLASYCVHLRKVHWRAGADWLYGHLLDGDLASNHLSWQWVASTFSSKPYLFNAANVAKYAPQHAWKAWASAKTAVDLSYEQLDTMAREQGNAGAEPGLHAAVAEPELLNPQNDQFFKHFEALACIPYALNAIKNIANQLTPLSSNTQLQLITPWALSERSQPSNEAPALRIGLILSDAHTALTWSERRWQFVLQRMAKVCDAVWIGKASDLAQLTQLPGWPSRERVHAQATLMDGYRQALGQIATLHTEPKLLAQPSVFCGSFSKYYERAQREQPDFKALLALPQQLSML
jgi:deoxyribodipyrimidine photo-lyase